MRGQDWSQTPDVRDREVGPPASLTVVRGRWIGRGIISAMFHIQTPCPGTQLQARLLRESRMPTLRLGISTTRDTSFTNRQAEAGNLKRAESTGISGVYRWGSLGRPRYTWHAEGPGAPTSSQIAIFAVRPRPHSRSFQRRRHLVRIDAFRLVKSRHSGVRNWEASPPGVALTSCPAP